MGGKRMLNFGDTPGLKNAELYCRLNLINNALDSLDTSNKTKRVSTAYVTKCINRMNPLYGIFTIATFYILAAIVAYSAVLIWVATLGGLAFGIERCLSKCVVRK